MGMQLLLQLPLPELVDLCPEVELPQVILILILWGATTLLSMVATQLLSTPMLYPLPSSSLAPCYLLFSGLEILCIYFHCRLDGCEVVQIHLKLQPLWAVLAVVSGCSCCQSTLMGILCKGLCGVYSFPRLLLSNNSSGSFKDPGLDVAAFPKGQAVCAAGSPCPAL